MFFMQNFSGDAVAQDKLFAQGTAEVVFSRRQDALAAVKRYNNVQLDGKPMKIDIIGTNLATATAGPILTNGAFGDSIVAPPRR